MTTSEIVKLIDAPHRRREDRAILEFLIERISTLESRVKELEGEVRRTKPHHLLDL